MSLWLSAARPRTLLLAGSSILLGTLLAAADGAARPLVALLALLTATLLQVLSNLANDLGDARHGADSAARVGPARAVSSGRITPAAMRRAVVLMAVAAAASGLVLVALAFGGRALLLSLFFVALGGAAIWAAVAYTATAKPYGYAGLGDFMVFVFFGLVGVLGAYALQAGLPSWPLLLPAAACGLLAVGVLNVNNVRDLESDRAAGKRSVAVRLGPVGARRYHVVLLTAALLLALAYVLRDLRSPWQFLFLGVAPLVAGNALALWRRRDARRIDPLLKQMALASLLFAFLFGVGAWLASL